MQKQWRIQSMNIKQLIDKILDKWPVKIICLVLAIMLYVLHQSSMIKKQTFTVPLTIKENGLVSVVNDLPSSVQVMIRGNEDDLKSITSTELHASLNLDYFTESGNYEVLINLKKSDRLLGMDPLEVTVKPEILKVSLEKRVLKSIPLIPNYVGEVAHGYLIDSIDVNPPYLDVTGPETIVNKTNQIYTNRVNVSNAETNFTVETNYFELNRLLTVENKGPYKVTFTLVPEIISKSFNDVPVFITGLSDDFALDGVSPTVNLTLEGTLISLEDYTLPVNAVRADFSEITETGIQEIELNYVIASNFKMINHSKDSILVNIIKKDIPVIVPEEESVSENPAAEEL